MNERNDMRYENQLKYDQMLAFIDKAQHCRSEPEWDEHVDNMRALVTPRGTMNRQLLMSTAFQEWSRKHFKDILASSQRHFANKEKGK